MFDCLFVAWKKCNKSGDVVLEGRETSWNLVCADKRKGGLGVGSLKAMNLAMLTKWWWRFKTEKDGLWKKVIQSLHGETGGFNKTIPSGRFTGIWNNILKILKDFHKVNIPLPSWFQEHQNQDDQEVVIKWALDPSGLFSVSSLRKACDDYFLKTASNIQFNWNNWVPSSVNILAWRFFHKRLPTKVNLVKRGVTLPSVTCSFCNYADENEDHLFSDCRLSIKILKEVCNWWGFDDAIIRDNCSILDWDNKLNLSGNKRKAFMGVVYVFL